MNELADNFPDYTNPETRIFMTRYLHLLSVLKDEDTEKNLENILDFLNSNNEKLGELYSPRIYNVYLGVSSNGLNTFSEINAELNLLKKEFDKVISYVNQDGYFFIPASSIKIDITIREGEINSVIVFEVFYGKKTIDVIRAVQVLTKTLFKKEGPGFGSFALEEQKTGTKKLQKLNKLYSHYTSKGIIIEDDIFLNKFVGNIYALARAAHEALFAKN